ncbi:Uncharacterized [Moorella glycerini]|uniref:Uncharacterized protein n=1 Tax=Neomoorella stamsii TaxID=1266720 RepID=A0A9X7J084_9FIRM|nr:hypothetical protein MOST_28380 [Moorella stamsii]CEP68488.1 Uncharacterized [Moorella glycerini]
MKEDNHKRTLIKYRLIEAYEVLVRAFEFRQQGDYGEVAPVALVTYPPWRQSAARGSPGRPPRRRR